jgi:predicted RNA-binding protein YlxR (DUF448 family)
MPTVSHSRPQRTCVGCRVVCAQDDLLRLQLVSSEGTAGRIAPGMARRARTGRSAYVCPRRSCLDQAIKRRAFTRAFSSRDRSRSVETLDSAAAEALWTAAREQILREIELYDRADSPAENLRRRSLERLSFELSCPPIPPVRSDRRARSNGQGGSPTHG